MKFVCGLLALSLLAAGTTWKFVMPVLERGAAGAFDETAVKDPSIVRYGGEWHVFYTARGMGKYSLGYVATAELGGLQGAPRHRLGGPGYAAAPQVFYFRPQQRWYLIYQTTASNYQPVFATTATLERPESWSAARPLVEKAEKDKWIDFWVICDDRLAWLFYTRNQSEVWAMTTPIGSFPLGFGSARKVMGESTRQCISIRTRVRRGSRCCTRSTERAVGGTSAWRERRNWVVRGAWRESMRRVWRAAGAGTFRMGN